MADLLISRNDEEKLDMQRLVLEYLIRNKGGSTRHLRQQYEAKPYLKKDKWRDVRVTIYALRNLGLIEQVNFAQTNGQVYQATDYGLQYFDIIK
jgi:hypothetical protein